jgi:hypothetical protein
MVDLAAFALADLQAALTSHPSHLTETGCLIWDGPRRPAGYGLTRVAGETASVHRVACFVAHGAPASGKTDACHTCDDPSCFAEEHLFWGSRSENMLDASAKRRLPLQQPGIAPSGHSHPRSRLTEDALRRIVLTDTPTRQLARELGYDAGNIRAIRNGRLWVKAVAEIRALSNTQTGGKL